MQIVFMFSIRRNSISFFFLSLREKHEEEMWILSWNFFSIFSQWVCVCLYRITAKRRYVAAFCRWHLFCFRSIRMICVFIGKTLAFLFCSQLNTIQWIVLYARATFECDYEKRNRCEWKNQNYYYIWECNAYDARIGRVTLDLVIRETYI